MLIKTIADIRQFCPVVNAKTAIDNYLPSIRHIEENLIIPAIGQSLYNELDELPADSTDNDRKALLSKSRETIAFLSVLRALPFVAVKIGDMGLHRMENDTHQAAYKYQETELKQSLRSSGISAMESLLLFLDGKREVFTDWANTATAKALRGSLINSTFEFNAAYPIENSPVVFMAIRPFMQVAEDFDIRPAIGAELFAQLKTGILSGNLSEAQTGLLDLLRKALAYYTAVRFCTRNGMSITDKGYFFETVESQPINPETKKSADHSLIVSLMNSDKRIADDYLKLALEFIGAHPEDFPVLPAARGRYVDSVKPRKIQPIL